MSELVTEQQIAFASLVLSVPQGRVRRDQKRRPSNLEPTADQLLGCLTDGHVDAPGAWLADVLTRSNGTLPLAVDPRSDDWAAAAVDTARFDTVAVLVLRGVEFAVHLVAGVLGVCRPRSGCRHDQRRDGEAPCGDNGLNKCALERNGVAHRNFLSVTAFRRVVR